MNQFDQWKDQINLEKKQHQENMKDEYHFIDS